MIIKIGSLATMAALLATTLSGSVAFAQGAQPSAPPPSASQSAPMTGMEMKPGGGMMGGGMMGQGGGMMGQGGTPGQGGAMGQMDMAEMKKMMDGCNKMMERGMQMPPAGSTAPDRKG